MEKAAGIAKLLFWITLYQADQLGVQMDETVFHLARIGLRVLMVKEHYGGL